MAKIGPVDSEIIGLTEIVENLGKKETAAFYKPSPATGRER